jgi:hypothetical protein
MPLSTSTIGYMGCLNYLHICFRWGGFPGLEWYATPPAEALADLTEGLLPM